MKTLFQNGLDALEPVPHEKRFLITYSKKLTCGIAVFLYWLVQALVNVWWIRTDTRPPFWDTAGHATVALRLTKLLLQGNPQAVFDGILSIGPYPPFVYLLSVPFVFLFGRTIDALVLTNLVFLGILFFSAYRLGRFFDRPVTGLLAVFLLGMYPVIYGLSRHYLLDVPLTAMVTFSIYCLVQTEHFKRLVPSIILGVSLGLGMLTKWTFVVFVAGPLLITMLYTFKSFSWSHIRNLLGAFLVGGLIAAPWYLHNLTNLTNFLPVAGGCAVLEGDPVGTWEAWLYYARKLADQQILLPFVVLFLVGLILLLRKRKLDEPFWTLFAWLLVPYLVFSYYANKDIRYTLPYLPAIALITAMGFSKVHNTKLVRGGTILVALYALIQFSGLSFGLTQRLPMSKVPTRLSVKLGNVPLAVYSERVHIASPPVVRDWKVQEVLNDVMSDASGSGRISPPIKLVVIPNSAFFEAQGFTYFVQANKLPIDVSFVTGVVEIDSSVQLVASDYVVTKTGDQGPRWTLQDAIVVTERLQQKRDNSGMQFVQIGEYALPDGSVAHLYRHRRASP